MTSAAEMLRPIGGGDYVFRWAMLPDVPVAHQRCEAIADLIDLLRDLGMVLTGGPKVAIAHGKVPVMVLEISARDATVAEARDLGHEEVAA